MRKASIATMAAALLVAAGCKGKDSAANDALARDVALAESSDGLTLAPKVGSQTVVSAEEQSRQAKPRVAPSSRASRPVPHRTPNRDRVAAQSQEVAAVADPAPETQPSVAVAPSSAPAPAEDAGPVQESPRPHPVDVQMPPSGGGDVGVGRGGGGVGIGDVIGILGGVVLRGGVADGDHCDPRGGRRGGGAIISINQRGPIFRGRF